MNAWPAWTRGAEQPISLEAVIQDAEFVRQQLGLTEELADIVPVALTPPLIKDAIQNLESVDVEHKIDVAFERISQEKDVVVLVKRHAQTFAVNL